MCLIFLFLYAPIFLLIVFSFNSTKSRTVWSGFTLDWYAQLFQDDTIISSLTTTLAVSVFAAIIATVAGTFAAIGFYNMKRRWRNPLLAVNNIPVINADIVTGVSLCLLFVSLGSYLKFELGFGTLIAHVTFNIPWIVMPKLYQMDKNLVDAARTHTRCRRFIKSSYPRSCPASSTADHCFTMSIDDSSSVTLRRSKVQTLSMRIYAMTRRRISPKINAVSTLLFIFVLIMLLIINVREIRQEKQLNKRALPKKINLGGFLP